jgi:hypothetical protein
MKFILLFALLFSAAIGYSQKGIRLTSRMSGRQKFIAEGSRVIYQYANHSHPLTITYGRYGQPYYHGIIGRGLLHVVNDSTIQVDQEVIRVKDLITLGQRNKGAWVGSFLLYWGGLGMMIGSISHHNDPPGVDLNVPLLAVGAGCMIAGVTDMINRLPKSMNIWRVQVVN